MMPYPLPSLVICASWAAAGVSGGSLELRWTGGALSPWEPMSCAPQGGPSGHDHVVLTGPAGPQEFWELVWEHGAHVLVSLCPPDTWEKVRGGRETVGGGNLSVGAGLGELMAGLMTRGGQRAWEAT